MIETLTELEGFLKLFNPSDPVFKALVGDKSATENAVPIGEYVTAPDINHGAISNNSEYERRLAKFLIKSLRLDEAQGSNIELIAEDWLGVKRPPAYTDAEYIAYTITRILAQKESSVSIVKLLEPFSIEPVIIYETGYASFTAFAGMSFSDHYLESIDGTTNLIVSPALAGGSASEGTKNYYFRVKIQPDSQRSAKLINELLKLSHVAGVRYDIELYYPIP